MEKNQENIIEGRMTAPDREGDSSQPLDAMSTGSRKGSLLPSSSSLDTQSGPENAALSTNNASSAVSTDREIEFSKVEDTPLVVAEDAFKTPTSETSGTINDIARSQLPSHGQSQERNQEQSDQLVDFTTSDKNDYFAAPRSQQSPATAPATGNNTSVSPGIAAYPVSRESSTPASPDSHPMTWKEFSAKHQAVPITSSSTTRPTSVPNFQSQSISRRREGPEYPNYPDQSFRALQDPQYSYPYRPVSPRPLRTRSSQLSQNSSFSASDPQPTADLPRIPSGAKTVGNTPAQSPGLFSPTFQAKRQWPCNADDSRVNTPMLHPTHHKPPKETHKLLKDIDPISGRKTINHYEVLDKLGSGQHGTVKQGRDLHSGEMVAIKIVRRFSQKIRLGRSGDPNDMIKKEVAILKKARHPHVVSLIEVIDDDEFGKVYLILEYVERGEIIWRKQTDKDIAAFETARTKREFAGEVDEEFEKALVAQFNSEAPAKRLEKARLLEQQKRQAKDRSAFHSSRPSGHSRSHFWSLEFDPNSDSELGFESSAMSEPEKKESLYPVGSSSSLSPTQGSPQSQSPSHTPRPPPQAKDTGSTPSSVPSSRPLTPAKLEGTMWGPYVDNNSTDFIYQSALDEIISGDTQLSPDDEGYRHVPCLTLSQALDAFRDTVLGLEYLHYQGIIHRDIKPANLLWTTDYRVKISDFGVSYLGKPIREDDNNEELSEADAAIHDEAIELAKTVGTPAFYAPELCDPQYFELGKHPDRPAITSQIDVWALGVTLYGMVFGRLPFYAGNEFQMYEKIAREEVYIPKKRLKGVEHTDKTPSNHNKRLDDVLEYEDVDDELSDLLKRLLDKHPAKRITLKEVKHHPWVLRGISDQSSWMDETDPSLQSQGKKIEISTQEIQDAVVGLTLVDRVKAGFQRVGSVLRGRGSRKRAESNPKAPETKPGDIVQPSAYHEERRTSLRGDEQIYTALRASRETTEHPLAQSVSVSPELRSDMSFFSEDKPARPISDPQASRQTFSESTLSTADSMKTIRASVPQAPSERLSANPVPSNEDFSMATAVPDSIPGSSSSLGGIFGGARRRFVNSMRSRERVGRQSPSQTSRSSSADRSVDDPHASPSLALSSAIAAGHVDHPFTLHEGYEPAAHPQYHPTTEPAEHVQEHNLRRQTPEYSYQGHARRPTVALAAEVACPPSPDEEAFFAQRPPSSATDSTTGFQISSSSDQIISGDSTVHSRIPSVVSGASSLSAATEESENMSAPHLPKSISPFTISQRGAPTSHGQQSDEALSTKQVLTPAVVEEEAGYNGEEDSDSDEGLAMA